MDSFLKDRLAHHLNLEFNFLWNILAGNFEKKVMEKFGITIQVASPDDSKLADNSATLSASGK